MNPLKLNKANRLFFEALVDLNKTDTSDKQWLVKYRRVKRIKQAEGKKVFDGWRCFYVLHNTTLPLPLKVAELFF